MLFLQFPSLVSAIFVEKGIRFVKVYNKVRKRFVENFVDKNRSVAKIGLVLKSSISHRLLQKLPRLKFQLFFCCKIWSKWFAANQKCAPHRNLKNLKKKSSTKLSIFFFYKIWNISKMCTVENFLKEWPGQKCQFLFLKFVTHRSFEFFKKKN